MSATSDMAIRCWVFVRWLCLSFLELERQPGPTVVKLFEGPSVLRPPLTEATQYQSVSMCADLEVSGDRALQAQLALGKGVQSPL